MDDSCTEWLRKFINLCLKKTKVPKIWKLAKIVAVLKRNKPPDVASSYKLSRTNFMNFYYTTVYSQNYRFCFTERTSWLSPWPCFLRPSPCCFDKNLKARVVFVELCFLWHSLSSIVVLHSSHDQVRNIIHIIMSTISQRRFFVQIAGKKSWSRTLSNDVQQGSVLAPLLFSIYTHKIPPTTSMKYTYPDDITLMASHKCFQGIERVLQT